MPPIQNRDFHSTNLCPRLLNNGEYQTPIVVLTLTLEDDAKYYSYLVARSSSSLIYDTLFAGNPFSRENGLKWAKVQSHGGEYPSLELLSRVLSKQPDAQQLTGVLQNAVMSDVTKTVPK